MRGRLYNLVGQTFGRLTVLKEATGHSAPYLCACVCGSERVVASQNLRRGLTRSCGCLNREAASARRRSHGMSNSAEHAAWTRLIDRCENKNGLDYPEYGARGISVAPEWRHDFAAFLEHIGPRPTSQHSVDRIDNSRGYEPGNVRWATPTQQARNTRRNRYITLDGVTRILTDWAALSGNSESTIFYRLKRGLAPKAAVFTPTHGKARQ